MYDLIDFISHYVQTHQAEYEAWLSSQGGGEGNEAGGKGVHHEGRTREGWRIWRRSGYIGS